MSDHNICWLGGHHANLYAVSALLLLAVEVTSSGVCQLWPNIPRPINPNAVKAGRLIRNLHARPDDATNDPYRLFYYVNTPWKHVNIDASIRLKPVTGQSRRYAIHLSATLSMPTGQPATPPGGWPGFLFYFVNHPKGDSNVLELSGGESCEKIIYTDNPKIQIMDVYAVPL